MEYNSMLPDIPSNMSEVTLKKGFDDFHEDTVCSNTDFVVRHLVRPAVEATFHAYIRNCTPKSEQILVNQWSLCTPEHDFNCESVYSYTSQCKSYRESSHCGYTTTTSKSSSMDRLMEDSSGVLLLVGLVFIGVLLGVASTVAVCLMCPQTHRWANSKLRNTPEYEAKTRASVTSDYYTAIHDNNVTLQLRPVRSPDLPSNTDTSRQRRPSTQRDFDDPNYVEPATRASPSPHPGFQPGAADDSSHVNGPGETYEPLTRNNTHNQSHNYAHIDPMAPCTPGSPDNEHSYFVLEKST
ncbi:uncharacterized protein LOC123529432 [Mercenaria mercenaria]|uniref:uncharacterized protein LOC123529432 n=1 Tax=Mercenaria mercenaria TaxID=6596 RepID=UPI00234EBF74|nr:uncharacterized protein LOC123529432 [Mercenaria mercenaria]